MPEALQLVWFKRDLRVEDHAALHAASQRGPVLPLYIVEPDYWQLPDSSGRQWRFVRDSLHELRETLARLGQSLVIRQGPAIEVLETLHRHHPFAAVHSHQETGNGWTYTRDRTVSKWLRRHAIAWQEYRQHGVVRPLRSRDGWSRQWEELMGEVQRPAPGALRPIEGLDPGLIPERPPSCATDPAEGRIAGGRGQALATLDSFLSHRGRHYSGGISSPGSAWTASSRLSPCITWGTLSLREVVQATRERRRQVRADAAGEDQRRWLRSLRAFEERLHWHCHFMQKLEDEPRIEFGNMHRACDGLRPEQPDPVLFHAWSRGETGFPLVDACMRALAAEGWLNFRMRAMLVSFAAYQLWLHWRQPALHMAQLFTDYEPGIHVCQFQMQSGTTGINALRIYNPVKQSLDQDPRGRFIRRWLPELARVPDRWLHEPWTMPPAVQRDTGCRLGTDYPERAVDHVQAARLARQRFTSLRRDRSANREADGIRERHASRRRPAPRRRAATPASPQLGLFDGDD